MDDCIFCKIAEKKTNSNIIFENDIIIAILDIDPISDGHILVIPKQHISDIHSLNSALGAEIMTVVKKMSDLINKSFTYDGIMLMSINGVFQDVPHFHFHVFGRNKNNDIKIAYPKNIPMSAAHLNQNALKIKANL